MITESNITSAVVPLFREGDIKMHTEAELKTDHNEEELRCRRRMRGMVVVGVVLAASGVSRAQQYRNPYNNMTFNNSFSRNIDMFNSMNQNFMNQMNRINESRAQLRKQLEGGQPARAPSPVRVAHQSLTATDFKPVDKGHPIIDQYVATFQIAPGDRDGLKQALEMTFKSFEKDSRKNNFATSFGIAIAAAMHVANGYDIPDAETDEMVANLNDAISTSPAWKMMSARDKQTVSDGMLLYAAMMVQLAAQPNENLKQAGVTMAQQFLAGLMRVGQPQQ
jgi:hypothetical protein